jgi:hypothetical protein
MRKIVLLAVFALFVAALCQATPLACGLNSTGQLTSAALLASIKAPLGAVSAKAPLGEKTGCSASIDCPAPGGTSTPLSCTGTGTCTVLDEQVECDGTLHSCSCLRGGDDPYCVCTCYEAGGNALQCFHQCGE